MVPATPAEEALPRSDWAPPTTSCTPPWPSHFVCALQRHGHLPRWADTALELSLWSDCSGINSEMFALNELRRALREEAGIDVKLNLYFTCDSDATCLEFARINHKPRHTSRDMRNRDVVAGRYWCDTHREYHDLPKRGLDVYVGTYPCSPWSRRGKRTGFAHPDAEMTIIGLKSIMYMRPGVWVIETGEMPSAHGLDDIMAKIAEVMQGGDVAYVIRPVRNLTPAHSGYPARRTRTFIMGWRHDLVDVATVAQPLECLITNPIPVDATFWTFLGLQCAIDWSRVGELAANPVEIAAISLSGCLCGVDPWAICPVHACKCKRCGDDGKSCKWRGHLLKFIEDEGLRRVITANEGTLTYMQVLELSGRRGPESPRSRILINLIAMCAKTRLLRDTLMIADISQNPPFGDHLGNGEAPVLTTTSQLWVLRAGEALRAQHCAALMGINIADVLVHERMTDSWMCGRLGLAVHVGNFGVILLAALTPCLRRAIG